MSISGAGRGRGWLNLNKNNTPIPRPGNTPSPQSPILTSPSETQFNDFTEDSELINKVKQLNTNDDGILFNQKIKYILEYWVKDCKSKDDVERSFNNLYSASLLEADLASKLIIMVSSRTFLKQEIGEQNIRHMFLKKLQNNFEDCSQLKITNPVMFRNCILMLGEFYNKARLANGQQFTFLSTPLIAYLEMLLESNIALDLKLFTTQLYLNGSSLKTVSPEKIAEIISKIRLALISDKLVLKESKLWLLLALDLSNNRFGLLPCDVQKFYEEHLGDAAVASCQGSHNTTLSIQTTQASNALDSFQSNVNVLQVSTSPDEPIVNSTFNNIPHNYPNSGFSVDSSQNVVSRREQQNSQQPTDKGWEKTGRPILGAGARLNKNKSQEDVGNWRDRSKENAAGWNSKQKNTSGSGWGSGNGGNSNNKKMTNVLKSNKGWEHDDRFDTDYN